MEWVAQDDLGRSHRSCRRGGCDNRAHTGHSTKVVLVVVSWYLLRSRRCLDIRHKDLLSEMETSHCTLGKASKGREW